VRLRRADGASVCALSRSPSGSFSCEWPGVWYVQLGVFRVNDAAYNGLLASLLSAKVLGSSVLLDVTPDPGTGYCHIAYVVVQRRQDQALTCLLHAIASMRISHPASYFEETARPFVKQTAIWLRTVSMRSNESRWRKVRGRLNYRARQFACMNTVIYTSMDIGVSSMSRVWIVSVDLTTPYGVLGGFRQPD